MARKTVDVAIVIPDASPLLTLARVDRLDLLDTFTVPIHIPDQVAYEARKPDNDVTGRVAAWFARKANEVSIVETTVGLGFQARRAKDPDYPSSDLGELAVEEYALSLARTKGPSFAPLVLFEDPDVLELRIARVKGVHLLNTAGWLLALEKAGVIEDGRAVLRNINDTRATPMRPVDRPARTGKIQSTFVRKAIQR
jgi:hypothetical protein